ncbi:MAG: hypothetical protein ACFFAN_04950 [Promethearchaeota archaeon]
MIFAIVGILIALKYFEVKNKTYIWWAIGVFGMGIPWLGGAISFLIIIMGGEPLTLEQYLFISLFSQPITLIFWLWTITELMYKNKQKIILGIYAISGIIFEMYLIYYLITNPLVIGIFVDPPLDINYVGLTMLYAIFILITVSISLLLFVRSGLKSDNPEVKLKAKFNLVAIISFVFGAVLDGYVSVNIVAVFIVRIILISAAIEFYIGWILPKSVKKIFLKNE